MGDSGAGQESGPRWGCLSQDRATGLVVAWAFAPTEAEAAPAVIAATRRRTRDRAGAAWVSDGHKVYEPQVRRVYRDPQHTGQRGRPRLAPTPEVALTQAIKQREGGRVVSVTVRATIGPVSACPCVVCEERCNGVLRDRLNCLTRKTHALAKRVPTWGAAVSACLFEQNWLKPHMALRQPQEGLPGGRRYRQRSPAMAAQLTDHVWTWAEFLCYRVQQHYKE